MRTSTFDTYKSTNLRLHNKLSQQDEYSCYLRRIEQIVDKKPRQDHSPQFYMTFLNKSRQKSNQQKDHDRSYLLQLQNKHLLQKIQKEKNRKEQKPTTLHEVHMYEKRLREQQRINEENSKMARRIMHQDSYLKKKKLMEVQFGRESPEKGVTNKRLTEMRFFDSRVKHRELPKLVRNSSLVDVQQEARTTYFR